MTQENISQNKTYYDNRFGTLSQNLNEEEQIRWNAISKALQSVKLSKNIRIADFGCGRGWLSQKLSQYGKVTGFDLSEKAIENAKHSFPDLEFVCLNAAEAIPKHFIEQFDLVVSSEVIEHIDHQQQYLTNISQLLKANGHFIISTPNGEWKQKFYSEGREQWKQPLENWLRIESLEELLMRSGLKSKYASTFNSEWIFQFQPKISIVWIAKPIARKTLKVFGIYTKVLHQLNKNHFGLNIILIGKK
jgi:SAM-dependent methyltransferase